MVLESNRGFFYNRETENIAISIFKQYNILGIFIYNSNVI